MARPRTGDGAVREADARQRRVQSLRGAVLPIASVAARLAHDDNAATRLTSALAKGDDATVQRVFQSAGARGVTYKAKDPRRPDRGGSISFDAGPIHIRIEWRK